MTQKYCACDKCKGCCTHLPGASTPDDVLRIAAHLKLSVKDCLQRFFVAGYREIQAINDGEIINFVYPAVKGSEGRKEDWLYPFNAEEMPCVFFKKGLCAINSVKPQECLRTFACKDSPIFERDEVMKVWAKAHKEGTIHPDILEFMENAVPMDTYERSRRVLDKVKSRMLEGPE